ncbi:BrnA antitoxin family protein [Acidovorax sp. CCYZU-2555]|uniref:BrnA antitoxin family protein n=1 Tax=Acidovorax sp. CCYZU-2555 TaxID=2835042 RepID=UPI0020C16A1F|nr:BrnA antitoxin family protein [Acidovorax sp. CCYZU-2555]
MNKRLSKAGLIVPTNAEDAAINSGIAVDPETMEIIAGLAARMKPLMRRGRPTAQRPKTPITTRIDADVLDGMKEAARAGKPASRGSA